MNKFELTSTRDMTRILASLSGLQKNNFLTGIAVEVSPDGGCSERACSVTIRKSTIRRRFGSINLFLSLQQTEDGIRATGFSEIDWVSYWPVAILAVVIIFSLLTGVKDSVLFLIFGGGLSLAYIGVAFFEQQNIIEEVKTAL